jgi:hypothetical protein
MSLTKDLIKEINRANAQHSSGPTSRAGKQRSSMNAMKHNLSGQHLLLLETEAAAYNRMAASMLIDLKPKSEPERQIAQKIIDTNFRLNRLTAIENNLFSFGIAANETDTAHDDRLEVMAAQTRAWMERGSYFDNLGRYEARLSRQLLKYQEEFERLQAARKEQERIDSHRSRNEIKRDQFDPASFGPPANSYRILSHLPPPKDDSCTAGDLVAGVLPRDPQSGSAGDLVAGPSSPKPENMAA